MGHAKRVRKLRSRLKHLKRDRVTRYRILKKHSEYYAKFGRASYLATLAMRELKISVNKIAFIKLYIA